MRICLSARQQKEYLERVDEIIFEYRDRDAVIKYHDLYPDKMMNLNCSDILKIDWEQIIKIKDYIGENFVIGIDDVNIASICNNFKIKFYFTYPITSYDELSAVINLGSYYIRLGASLFFDLDNIQKFFPEIKIRLIPNVAYDDQYTRYSGIYGTWIRPEDLILYDEYADIVEFQAEDPQRERALYRIYIEEHTWPGDLDMIITNFNATGQNAFLPPDMGEKRLNCRQRCMSRQPCHICKIALAIADRDLLEDYEKAVIPKYQAPKNED